jgi:hypothetical protein
MNSSWSGRERRLRRRLRLHNGRRWRRGHLSGALGWGRKPAIRLWEKEEGEEKGLGMRVP